MLQTLLRSDQTLLLLHLSPIFLLHLYLFIFSGYICLCVYENFEDFFQNFMMDNFKPCWICGVVFQTWDRLHLHMLRAHTNHPHFNMEYNNARKCDLCHYWSSTPKDYADHYVDGHPLEVCGKCKYRDCECPTPIPGIFSVFLSTIIIMSSRWG